MAILRRGKKEQKAGLAAVIMFINLLEPAAAGSSSKSVQPLSPLVHMQNEVLDTIILVAHEEL